MNDVEVQRQSLPPSSPHSDRSILLYTTIAVGLALAIRFFVAAPYLVSGPSMDPTFHDHDYLIVERLSYQVCTPWPLSSECWYTGNPERGDVIVFSLPQNPSETLIKRVIGLPGETVSVSGTAITITNASRRQGFTLSEPYIDPQDAGGASGMKVTLGADEYFVMGDNRKVSYDSRLWGPLPRKDIIGKVFVRLFPFNEIGMLPGEARY